MGSFPIEHRDDYWKIWFEVFKDGEKVGGGVWHQSYKYKGNATRVAKKHFDREIMVDFSGSILTYNWIVSQTNPWAK